MTSSVVSRPGSIAAQRSPTSAETPREVMAPLAMTERSNFAERSDAAVETTGDSEED